MNKFLQIGLVGVGGYFLYEWAKQNGWIAGGIVQGETAPAPGTTPAGTTATAPPSTAVAATNWTKFADAIKAAGYSPASSMSCDQWNWFYNNGASGPAPDPIKGCVNTPDRAYPVAYSFWRDWMKQQGLGRVRRTGYVGHYSAFGRNFGYGQM